MDGKQEITVAYPDLQIRRWSPKKFFSAFVHQFGPKIGGGGGVGGGGVPPLEPPLNYLSKLQGTKSSNQHHISPCNINDL